MKNDKETLESKIRERNLKLQIEHRTKKGADSTTITRLNQDIEKITAEKMAVEKNLIYFGEAINKINKENKRIDTPNIIGVQTR